VAKRPDWLLRSLLFAPGNHPRRVAKVGSFGADAIVLDLEDAVAAGEKTAARALVRAALPGYPNTLVMVRVNGPTSGRWAGDLEAVVCPSLQAIVIPKVETPAQLREVDERLALLEEREGLTPGTIRLIPQIETARGIVRVDEIALQAPARVQTLIFGQADFTADLGIELTPDGDELLYARSRVVVAARAAGLAPPIDGPYLLGLQDEPGLVRDCERARRLGFQGKIVIHPSQVEPVNRVFGAVSPEELAVAREIVTAFEAAEAAGSAAIQVAGRFVDYPIYRQALRKLQLPQK
jgi:citrate lyase subunit beta / citryl-CoA lyase